MLNPKRFFKALQETRPQLEARLDKGKSRARKVSSLQKLLQNLQHAETLALLDKHDDIWTGARTTPEVDAYPGFCVSFRHNWCSRREAQEWAHAILLEQPIVAVDGSQLVSERGLSLAIGAVQIGYYVNDPLTRCLQQKQDFELILPAVSATWMDELQNQAAGLTQEVYQRRFVRECQKIPELAAGLDRAPVCFFDNTFILSFLQSMNEEQGAAYVEAVETLLQASARQRFPVVGYVDTSYSRDLWHMLEIMYADQVQDAVTDAGMLRALLPRWGDRTPFMQCARADALSRKQAPPFYYSDVGFVYMRTDPQAHPSRIELPMWVYEEGKLEEVLNVIRAQCINGGFNYPHALALADQLAVLTQQDRAQFYDGLKQYLRAELGQNLHRPAKANSKRATRFPV